MIGADPAGLARFEVCCTLIYLIIIGGYPALYSVRRGGGIWIDGSAAFDGMPSNVSQAVHSGLCGCCIVCAGMGQINGNDPVKPCALFCSVCDNNRMDCTKRAVNACMGLYCRRAEIKALHPQQMQGKRKARSFLTGWNASYLDALNSAEKNQKKNRSADNITAYTPLYHAKPLVCGFAATLCVYIRVCCL